MKKWMAYLPFGLLCGSLVVIGGIWGKRLESHLERTVGIAASEGGSERISRFEYTVWDHRCEAEMEFFHQGWRFAERILYPVL